MDSVVLLVVKINVAYSTAKQIVESPMTAKTVKRKLDKILPLQSCTLVCGVVVF